MTRRGVRGRTLLAVLIGLLFVNLAMISLWSWRTFASSQGFADVTTDMLKEPAVREAIAEQIVDKVEAQSAMSRIAVTARPVLESVVADLVETDAFQGVFHAGVRELHSAVVEGRRSRLLVNVDDAADLVRNSLETVNPQLAAAIPDQALTVLVGISQSTPIDTTMRLSSLAGWLVLPFIAIAIGCFVIAVRRSDDRRRVTEAIGLGLVATGVAHFALLSVGVNLAASLGDDPRQRTALRAVFWSAAHLLNVQAKVVITIGAVLAIAAAHAGTGEIRARLGRLVDQIRSRLAQPLWRAFACLAAIGVGYFAMRWPEATTSIAVRIVAFVGFIAGAIGLLDVLGSVNWARDASAQVQRVVRRFALGATAALAVVSATLLFGGLAFARSLRAPGAESPDVSGKGCNSHIELCDRRIDQVVLAGTHNSMAATAANFVVARQSGGIGAQLASGVRAFLVDLHYGGRTDTLVRTNFQAESDTEALDGLTPSRRATVERSLAILGAPPEKDDVYLCHVYCELGATRAVDAFRGMNDFLRENPNEVVVLMLEDFVSGEDGVRELERSGLAGRAWRWEDGEPLPTLREMIERKRNLLVLVENDGGAEPWYAPAFDVLQETQYRFEREEDFSCELGRGSPDNPLFLVNHWLTIDPPDPKPAEEVNEHDFLLDRANECQDERDRTPNILAVDFYALGDLFEVVDELNGV